MIYLSMSLVMNDLKLSMPIVVIKDYCGIVHMYIFTVLMYKYGKYGGLLNRASSESSLGKANTYPWLHH